MATASDSKPMQAAAPPRDTASWGFRAVDSIGALVMICFGVPALLSPPMAAAGSWQAWLATC